MFKFILNISKKVLLFAKLRTFAVKFSILSIKWNLLIFDNMFNYSKTWFGAQARFESRWWSCFPSDFSSGAAFTLAYSSNNLSESINASLNKQISDRSKLNFPRACALLAEWKRGQMESLLLIRRLNVPSRSSNRTLISHAMRYRFQKRLNDLVRNQFWSRKNP